jgi:peptide/nickel transport system permease protein
MLGFIIRRLALAIPTLFLVAVTVFVIVRLFPGDPVLLMLGDRASDEQLADLKHQLGLDLSIAVQFWQWLSMVVVGDLGHSLTNGLPVLPLILDRFMVSATIVLLAVGLATLIAVPLGLLAAWRQNKVSDFVIVTTATMLLSVPAFWLGLVLLLVFGSKLGWLPIVGYVPFSENPYLALTYIILPVATLTAVEIGALTRMSRASAIEVQRLEYVAYARSKGVPEWLVLLKHILPNAFAPTWTLIGLTLGNLLGGIAVLETVFTIPGLGRLLVDSVFDRDYPVVQGCLLLTALIYVLVNLLVDLCYPLFDPRVASS